MSEQFILSDKYYNIDIVKRAIAEAETIMFHMGRLSFTLDDENYFVYNPKLYVLLRHYNIPLKNPGKTIDGNKFKTVYIEGYKAGVQYFKTDLTVPYDPAHIIACFFEKNTHTKPEFRREWNFWLNETPASISEDLIKNRWGFVAGIFSEVEKRHPLIELYKKKLSSVKKSGSYREMIFAHHFKVKTGLEEPKSAKEWKSLYGEKCRQTYYTTVYSKNSKTYKPHTQDELENIIELLEGFPEAQALAKTELEKL